MIEIRSDHAAVSMGNKLFVIGRNKSTSCEVFDNFSRQFTEIKPDLMTNKISRYFKAVCIGNNIVVFHSLLYTDEPIIYVYDVCENKWSVVDCDFTKNLFDSSFVKYYA